MNETAASGVSQMMARFHDSSPRLAGVIAMVLAALGAGPAAAASAGEDVTVTVFDEAVIDWEEAYPIVVEPDGYVVRHRGHTVEGTFELPDAPAGLRETRRIIAVVDVEPILGTTEGGVARPNDLWTRLGNVTVLVPDGEERPPREAELLRFITGYGAAGHFEQDVTALAPLLQGPTRIRAFLSSYSEKPGWRLSLRLRYTAKGIGPRAPAFARPLVMSRHATAETSRLRAELTMPDGYPHPRLRILSTGHATDGRGANEFVSCTHVLRIDGREVARWRPWSEEGGLVRPLNPWAGRDRVEGREIRSSDFDRSGWHPGRQVVPLLVPVPELTPGPHTVEIEILGIRPKDPKTPDGKHHHGYWVVSAAVVADRPWLPGR